MKRTDFLLTKPTQSNPHAAGARAKKYYNTTKWRKLRTAHLMTNPMCEKCNIEPATEVHHKIPILTAFNDLEQMALAFDPSNLMSVCSECHKKIHAELKL